MVIVYVFTSFLGALTAVALLSSYSWVVALLCAPLGGSALALFVGVGISALQTFSQPRSRHPTAGSGVAEMTRP
jgi:hypothetical protein